MNVKIANTIKYGYLKQFRKRAEKLERFIYNSINEIRCEFKHTFVKGMPSIIIRPCRGNVYGYYDIDEDIIAIDIRHNRSRNVLLNTLIHEMVHARQARQGRLKSMDSGFIWKGRAYIENDEDYDSYAWEIEANKVADEMINKLKYKYGK